MDKVLNKLRNSFRNKNNKDQSDQKSPTEGKVIKTRAIVCWGPLKAPTIEELYLDPPKSGEVRVKIASAGICHSDVTFAKTKETDDYGLRYKFPSVMGHEGAGIVESVGPEVKSVKMGDHVLLMFVPYCGECVTCKNPDTNICIGPEVIDSVAMADGTTRMSLEGEPIYNCMGGGCFSEYQVLSETRIAKIDKNAPLDKVCLLSCGIGTGYGAAVKVAKVKKGSTVAVWGLGTIGLAAVVGAKDAGAVKIIGIDTNKNKFELAQKFGATATIDPNDKSDGLSVDDKIRKETNGLGVDYAFDCVGSHSVLYDAIISSAGWGTIVAVGLIPNDIKVSFKHFLMGKKLTGCLYGGYKGRHDVSHLVDRYMSGKLDIVNECVSKKIRLDDVPDAIAALMKGEVLRSVVVFEN